MRQPIRTDHNSDGTISKWDPNAEPDALAGVVVAKDGSVLFELRLRDSDFVRNEEARLRKEGLLDGQMIDGNYLVRNKLEPDIPVKLPLYVLQKRALLTSSLKEALIRLPSELNTPQKPQKKWHPIRSIVGAFTR